MVKIKKNKYRIVVTDNENNKHTKIEYGYKYYLECINSEYKQITMFTKNKIFLYVKYLSNSIFYNGFAIILISFLNKKIDHNENNKEYILI